jgi:hypothetical protein
MVAAFGNDASAKLGPLIEKFQGALSAAGGAEALAAQVRRRHARFLCAIRCVCTSVYKFTRIGNGKFVQQHVCGTAAAPLLVS